VFEALGKTAKSKTCKAMHGLIEEATELMEGDADDAVMDAGLIAAAQKVITKLRVTAPSALGRTFAERKMPLNSYRKPSTKKPKPTKS
jgi:hypothetical protein